MACAAPECGASGLSVAKEELAQTYAKEASWPGSLKRNISIWINIDKIRSRIGGFTVVTMMPCFPLSHPGDKLQGVTWVNEGMGRPNRV